MKNKRNKLSQGLSMIEILVVITIFAMIGVLTTRSISMTLRGAKKSESQIKVRENINYALDVIERQIRNAESVTCPSSGTDVQYVSAEGVATSFSYVDDYIASGSGRLTSSEISVTECLFTCTQNNTNEPPSISILISAEDTVSTSTEKGVVTTETQIISRNY